MSSSKDQGESLNKVATLFGEGSPVSAIAPLEQSYGKAIVYSGVDKKLRMCKEDE